MDILLSSFHRRLVIEIDPFRFERTERCDKTRPFCTWTSCAAELANAGSGSCRGFKSMICRQGVRAGPESRLVGRTGAAPAPR